MEKDQVLKLDVMMVTAVNKILKYIVILTSFLGVSIASCDSGNNSLASLLVVDGAEEIQKSTSHDGRRTQVNYNVSLKYPNVAVGENKFEILKNDGWVNCSGPKDDWDSFPDLSSGKSRLAHQRMSYWVKGHQILTVAMRYYSAIDKEKGLKNIKLRLPSNDKQYVFILHDKYENNGQLGQVLSKLKILCP